MPIKLTPEISEVIKSTIEKFPTYNGTQIAEVLYKSKQFRYSIGTLKILISKYRKENNLPIPANRDQELPSQKKIGLELKGNHIVVNWNSETVITDLGEFGQYICDLNTHNAIQRTYTSAGDNETASIVAMKFDFSHAKAVHLYARLHGFTKSSLPQSDLAFEAGLTEDEAIQQGLQALKRKIHKKLEKEKWKFIQDNSDKWLRFDHLILKPLEYHIEAHLDNYQPPILDLTKLKKQNSEKMAVVLGLSDWHFMKLCYSPDGRIVYDKKIAKERIKHDSEELMKDMLIHGEIEKIFVPIGNDNIHIDGPEHATTAGTPQINATDGIWRIGISEYIDITLDYINAAAQIAPVEAMVFPGNHDEKTSMLLQVFLKKFYQNNDRVKINTSLHSRLYTQYGKNCLIFTHSHQLGKRLPIEIHKIILGEAKEHGISLDNADNYLLFGGHEHVGSFKDLNGNVQQFVMPSLSGIDDFWHRSQEYVGRACESAAYGIHPTKGRRIITYSS